MSKLKKAALYLGFTRTEFNIILFLIGVLILGITLTFIKRNSSYTEIKNYNYEARDSIFLSAAAGSQIINYPQGIKADIDDSSFVKKSSQSQVEALPREKSININAAGINDLIKLPGIGEKTALKIIDMRKEKGGFTKIDELKEIKGIGDSKLEKISKYIYIE